jgi:hypothetical protein
MATDGLCCLGCKQPATHTFKNLETGYQNVLCEQHAKTLDVRDQSKFLRLPSGQDEQSTKLKQEIADAYSHRKLEGHRLPQQTVDDRSASLVTDRQMDEIARQREEVRARKWEQSIERDPWLR